MIYPKEKCNGCKFNPPHVSTCFNTKGYCKYFPYQMSPKGNNADCYKMKDKHCKTCKHFIGSGDWDLCCDLPHPDYPCGFLCYEDDEACEQYEENS